MKKLKKIFIAAMILSITFIYQSINDGVGARTIYKHWECDGPLIIDARIKPHHAPELVRDKKTIEKVDKLFSKGGELYGLISKSI